MQNFATLREMRMDGQRSLRQIRKNALSFIYFIVSTYLQEMNRKRDRYIWVWEGIV